MSDTLACLVKLQQQIEQLETTQALTSVLSVFVECFVESSNIKECKSNFFKILNTLRNIINPVKYTKITNNILKKIPKINVSKKETLSHNKGINISNIPSDLLNKSFSYLDIKSLINLQFTNRLFCIEARKPQSYHNEYFKFSVGERKLSSREKFKIDYVSQFRNTKKLILELHSNRWKFSNKLSHLFPNIETLEINDEICFYEKYNLKLFGKFDKLKRLVLISFNSGELLNYSHPLFKSYFGSIECLIINSLNTIKGCFKLLNNFNLKYLSIRKMKRDVLMSLEHLKLDGIKLPLLYGDMKSSFYKSLQYLSTNKIDKNVFLPNLKQLKIRQTMDGFSDKNNNYTGINRLSYLHIESFSFNQRKIPIYFDKNHILLMNNVINNLKTLKITLFNGSINISSFKKLIDSWISNNKITKFPNYIFLNYKMNLCQSKNEFSAFITFLMQKKSLFRKYKCKYIIISCLGNGNQWNSSTNTRYCFFDKYCIYKKEKDKIQTFSYYNIISDKKLLNNKYRHKIQKEITFNKVFDEIFDNYYSYVPKLKTPKITN